VTIRNQKRFSPVFFYGAVLAALWLALLALLWPSTRAVLTLVSLGFVSWQLVEYGLHRFVFHLDVRSEVLRRVVYQAHLAHHENPRMIENVLARAWLVLPIAVLYFLLARVSLGSWAATVYLWSGFAAGYLTYKYLHYQAHHGRPRVALFRYLKKYHLLHHHRTPDLRFGVTSPAIDCLFGTYRARSAPLQNRAQ